MVVLNGWQRLWIVACVALTVPWLALGAKNFPSEESITKNYGWERGRYEYDLQCFKDQRQSVGRPTAGPCNGKSAADVRQALTDSMLQYDVDIQQVGWLRVKSIVFFVMLWALSCALLYGLGWTVAWVIRGFRQKGQIIS